MLSKCRTVRIEIDIGKANVYYYDESAGISSEILSNISSSIESKASCSSLPEMLELAYLSTFSISSRTSCSKFTFTASNAEDMGENRDLPGTTICLRNIFGAFPVRQKSFNKISEMHYVNEYLQSFSLLHHYIDLIVIDVDTGKALFDQRPTESVLARLCSFHGSTLLSKLKVVRFSCIE